MDILDKVFRWLEGYLLWANPGFLGAMGGIANYYYLNITRNRRFVWGALLANVVLAFFLGRALSGFIPGVGETRDGLVMLVGFFAFPILHMLEAQVVALVERIFKPGGT